MRLLLRIAEGSDSAELFAAGRTVWPPLLALAEKGVAGVHVPK